MNYYQKQIAKHTKENPAHVEAWIRLNRETMNGVGNLDLRWQIRAAVKCIRSNGPEISQRLADSMGIK